MELQALYELFLALFRSDAELRRFLNLAQLEEIEQRLSATKGESLRTTAYEAAGLLVEMGLVDEQLFAELARRSPERADDIWEVGREAGLGPGGSGAGEPAQPSPAPRASPPIPEQYADLAAELEQALAEALPPDPDADALQAPRWRWTAVASVLGSFRPHELLPLPEPDASGLPALRAFEGVVFTTTDGRWALENRVRTAALIRLRDEGALAAALDVNAGVHDLHRDLMRALLDMGDVQGLAQMSTKELSALDTVLRWLDPLELDLTEVRAAVYSAVERRALIDPLRKLVGSHFRGREHELSSLAMHVRGEDGATGRAIAVQGPGGAGKSSLIGKILLDLEDHFDYAPLAFAYVDFDKSRHNPRDARGLVEQIVRQLRLLYAVQSERSRGFAALESLGAGTDVELASEVLDLGPREAELDLDGLIAELASRLMQIPRAYPVALVLILDTLEEVQIQGPGALDDVRDLLRRLGAAIPEIRVILSGRGDLSGLVEDPDRDTITLGDLDRASAEAVLEALGVLDPSVRELVIDRFGGNPLVLHLAAEALRRMETAEHAFKGVLDRTDAVAAIGMEQVQGMLYERILGHIADPEIVKIAHPGLAVRRVTVDLIRDVLAEPCGLDPERAPAIFERLQLEISMFDVDDDGALRHRQDVRRLMLRAMANEPAIARTVAEIHRRAIDFYAASTGPTAAAEEVYHRLMSGQDPRTISVRWTQPVRVLLLPALEDPLPAPALTWLRRRVGLISPDEERAAWDQEDWEADTALRAQSWLASSDPKSALSALSERSERIPGSALYPLEVAALLDLERHDEAAAVLERGMHSCLEADVVDVQLDLTEQASRLAVVRGDVEQIVATSQSTANLAELTREPVRAIGDLTSSLAALQAIGASSEAEGLAQAIAERFANLPADIKRDNPALVRAVVQTAGAINTAVLADAAESVGPISGEKDAIFLDDAYALTRLLEGTRPEAHDAMSELAGELGLTGGWTPSELARAAVRGGRTGEAVTMGLDWASEASTARQTVVDELAVPVDLEGGTWGSSI